MTIGLFILTLIIIVIAMACPIIIMLIMKKKFDEKDLINKIIATISIINVIVLIFLLSIWISPIKSGNLSLNDSANNDNTNVTLETAGFNEVSLTEYLELIKSNEKSIILVARPTCGFCEKFTPILKQAMDDMKLKINYIDTDKLTTSEDWDKFMNSFEYLQGDWGTPLVLITQNGQIIDKNEGYTELSDIKAFFEKNK